MADGTFDDVIHFEIKRSAKNAAAASPGHIEGLRQQIDEVRGLECNAMADEPERLRDGAVLFGCGELAVVRQAREDPLLALLNALEVQTRIEAGGGLWKTCKHRRFSHGQVRERFCEIKLRRLGRAREARDAYQRALKLAQQEPERRFLERRIAELEKA